MIEGKTKEAKLTARKVFAIMEGGLVVMEVDDDKVTQAEPTLIEQEQFDRQMKKAFSVATRVINAVNNGRMKLGRSEVIDGVLYVAAKHSSYGECYLRVDPVLGDIVYVKGIGDPCRTKDENKAPMMPHLSDAMNIMDGVGNWLLEEGL